MAIRHYTWYITSLGRNKHNNATLYKTVDTRIVRLSLKHFMRTVECQYLKNIDVAVCEIRKALCLSSWPWVNWVSTAKQWSDILSHGVFRSVYLARHRGADPLTCTQTGIRSCWPHKDIAVPGEPRTWKSLMEIALPRVELYIASPMS